jgi:hypothetical protein
MRGLSRRKSAMARNRALRALPEDDGLVPILASDGWRRSFWMLAPPQAVHDHFAETMARHDKRRKKERWGGNQWGEEWVQKPRFRKMFARRMPLLLTDLAFRAWCRAIR